MFLLKPQVVATGNGATSHFNKERVYRGTWLNRPLAAASLLLCSPLMLTNVLAALVSRQSIVHQRHCVDSAGRKVSYQDFSCGYLKTSARLFAIARGDISFCGLPLAQNSTREFCLQLANRYQMPAGFFDAVSLHQRTGLAVSSPKKLLLNQAQGGSKAFIKLLIKGLLCSVLYGTARDFSQPKALRLFGIRINNVTMTDAVEQIMAPREGGCRIGYFINAHSVNVSARNADFRALLNQSEMNFADGSGLRIAAQSVGYRLADNVNGTDLFPHLCQAMSRSGKRLFLYGAAPGVADAMAANIQAQYPHLTIAGTAHGFLGSDEQGALVTRINQANTDILLVAMGSPRQEQWLQQHKAELNCQSALAVGGLFDFFSGNIARAPLWMRELGMEWVWRLLQEPKTKFTRYVIGNPVFLFRTFVLKAVSRGA